MPYLLQLVDLTHELGDVLPISAVKVLEVPLVLPHSETVVDEVVERLVDIKYRCEAILALIRVNRLIGLHPLTV